MFAPPDRFAVRLVSRPSLHRLAIANPATFRIAQPPRKKNTHGENSVGDWDTRPGLLATGNAGEIEGRPAAGQVLEDGAKHHVQAVVLIGGPELAGDRHGAAL